MASKKKMLEEFSDQNFHAKVIMASEKKPILVDFFADWCGPCKVQGPIIDQLAAEIGDKAIVGKIDTETNPKIAEEFGIMSIPTVMIFRNGKAVESLVGLQAKENLLNVLEKYV